MNFHKATKTPSPNSESSESAYKSYKRLSSPRNNKPHRSQDKLSALASTKANISLRKCSQQSNNILRHANTTLVSGTSSVKDMRLYGIGKLLKEYGMLLKNCGILLIYSFPKHQWNHQKINWFKILRSCSSRTCLRRSTLNWYRQSIWRILSLRGRLKMLNSSLCNHSVPIRRHNKFRQKCLQQSKAWSNSVT